MDIKNRIQTALEILLKGDRAFFTDRIPIGSAPQGFARVYRYEDYAKEGYSSNHVVFACIREIMYGCASVKLRVAVDDVPLQPGKVPENLLPLYNLYKRPNPNESIKEFVKGFALYLMVGGISYIQLINIGTRQVGRLNLAKVKPELWLYRPDRVRMEIKNRVVVEYVVDPNSADEKKYTANEFMYVKIPDAMGDYVGMPPLRAGARSVDTSNESLLWNFKLLKNSGIVSGVLSLMGLNKLTSDERKKEKMEWRKEYQGAVNAGKMMVVAGEQAKYTAFGVNAKDLDWVNGDKALMRAISMAMGVPSKLIGDPDSSTFNNVREARISFYENTIMPIMETFAEESTNSVAALYQPNASIITDTGHIAALREDDNSKYTRMQTAYWLTPNEKRQQCGFEPYKDDAADKIYLPVGMVEIGQLAEPPGSMFGEDDSIPEDDADKKQGSANKPMVYGARANFVYHPRSLFRVPEERAKFMQGVNKRKEPYKTKVRAVMIDYWEDQMVWVFEALEKYSGFFPKRNVIPGDLTASIFNDPKAHHELADKLLVVERGIIIDFGNYAVKGLLGKAGFVYDRPSLTTWVANDIADRSRRINQRSGLLIRNAINQGLEDGKGIVGIRDNIREAFDNMNKSRAALIANTEVTRATSIAAVNGYQQSGVDYHEWASNGHGDFRIDHMSMDGEVTKVGSNFSNGAPAPGMSGDPGQDCNCDCWTLPILPEDVDAGKLAVVV